MNDFKLEKKFLIGIVIIITAVILALVLAAYILTNQTKSIDSTTNNPISLPKYTETSLTSYPIKDGFNLIKNDEFNYRFQHRDELFIRSLNRDNFVHILGGNIISSELNPTKGYQLAHVQIAVLERSILEGLSLSQWVEKTSAETFETLLTDTDRYRYVSTDYKVILSDKIIFLVNKNPVTSSPPVLLFDNGTDLIEVTSGFADDLFFEISSDIQVKFDKKYIGLTEEEFNLIKIYYLEHEIY